MKKGLFALFACVLALLFAVPAKAADLLRVADFADLLTEEEETLLSDRLDEISERQQADVVVVTVDSLDGMTAMAYADDFYDYNGYGFGEDGDGILLLVSVEERDWHITTKGRGITAFTDAGLDYISEQFLNDLKGGDYAAAFAAYAGLCDDFLTQAATGEPYDVDHLPKGEFPAVAMFLFDLAIAFVIALIATGIMRLKLRSIGSEAAADNYVKKGSLKLTRETDLFLYRRLERSERPKEDPDKDRGGSTVHTSSSGEKHGGKGGKF